MKPVEYRIWPKQRWIVVVRTLAPFPLEEVMAIFNIPRCPHLGFESERRSTDMTGFLNSLVGKSLQHRRLFWRYRHEEWLQRLVANNNNNNNIRYESSASTATTSSAGSRLDDPGKLVAGLTAEDVASNPEIGEYLRSNFGGENNSSDGDDSGFSSGISIPPEVLKQFGIDDHEIARPAGKTSGDSVVDAGLGNAEQESLNIRVLRTYVRSADESNRRLRYNGIIPGILYGSDPTLEILSSDPSSKTLLRTPWPELQRELDRYHRRFESRVYDLTVFENEDDTDGEVHRVVPSSVQRHPVKGTIYCANFLRYHAGRPLKIPLTYVNEEESPALKRDGFIIPVNKFVECIVEDGTPIPNAVEVECTGLQVKDIVRIDRLIFPDGVRPVDKLNPDTFVVGPVRGGRSANTADDTSNEDSQATEA